MSESPSARKRRAAHKRSNLMSPKEFKETLKNHIAIAKELDKLIIEAKKTKANKVEVQGQTLGVKDIKTRKTLNYKYMEKLATLYRKTFLRVRPDRQPSANGG